MNIQKRWCNLPPVSFVRNETLCSRCRVLALSLSRSEVWFIDTTLWVYNMWTLSLVLVEVTCHFLHPGEVIVILFIHVCNDGPVFFFSEAHLLFCCSWWCRNLCCKSFVFCTSYCLNRVVKWKEMSQPYEVPLSKSHVLHSIFVYPFKMENRYQESSQVPRHRLVPEKWPLGGYQWEIYGVLICTMVSLKFSNVSPNVTHFKDLSVISSVLNKCLEMPKTVLPVSRKILTGFPLA